MNNRGTFNFLLLAVAFLGACATKPAVDRDQVTSIRKVAIVGMTALNQVPDPFEGKMPGPKMAGVPNLNTFAKQSETAANMLKEFSNDLRNQMRWVVLTPDQLIREDVYGDLYVSMMKNWKTMMTPDNAYQMHFVKNVLPYDLAAGFTQDVRDHLMKTLGVDALVAVQFKNSMTSTFGVNGLGNKHGQSYATLKVYKRGLAEPVWSDTGAEGAESNKSLSFLMGPYNSGQEPELFSIYEEATKLSTVALFNRNDVEEK